MKTNKAYLLFVTPVIALCGLVFFLALGKHFYVAASVTAMVFFLTIVVSLGRYINLKKRG